MKNQINFKEKIINKKSELIENKVSLRMAYKFKLCAWGAVFLCSELLLLCQSNGAGHITNNILRLFACLIIISMFFLEKKLNIEKGDELSNINSLKAGYTAAKIVLSLLICIGIIAYVLDKTIVVTMNEDSLFGWIMIIVSIYYALQSALFLAFDGDSEIKDDAEDE